MLMLTIGRPVIGMWMGPAIGFANALVRSVDGFVIPSAWWS
jgi:hypothetical protein